MHNLHISAGKKTLHHSHQSITCNVVPPQQPVTCLMCLGMNLHMLLPLCLAGAEGTLFDPAKGGFQIPPAKEPFDSILEYPSCLLNFVT